MRLTQPTLSRDPILKHVTILVLGGLPANPPASPADAAEATAVPAAPEAAVLAAGGVRARWIDGTTLGPAALEEALGEADFILTRGAGLDAAMLAQARRCLLIAHLGPGAGPGAAPIALEAARAAGIYLCSIPDAASDAWAAESLRLAQQVAAAPAVAASAPARPLRLGLIGLGQVGQRVARLAHERGWQPWACDPFAPDDVFAQTATQPADLETLCGVSDILSLHVPLGPATAGLLGGSGLACLRPGTGLVCTADPRLIDLSLLASFMDRERPAVAAFDADLTRFLPAAHPLLAPGRAVIHGGLRAGAGPPADRACRQRAGELILATLQGERPAHLLIDPPCPRHILLLAGQSWRE